MIHDRPKQKTPPASRPAADTSPACTPRTVAVTGATGFVGRAIVRELVARGHRVRALARDLAKAGQSLPTGSGSAVTVIVGDALKPGVMEELATGADAVIHLIGIAREAPKGQTFRRMHVDATQAAVDAAVATGARRFVHMSALAADPEGPAPYQRTKYEGECAVQRSGLDWTILRPTIIHGPGGEFMGLMQDLASGEVAPWFFMPYFSRPEVDPTVPAGHVQYRSPIVQPVSIFDVARVFVDCLDLPASIGEVYNIVGSERIDWPTMLDFLRDTLPRTDHSLRPFMIPGTHGAMLARAAAMVGLGSLLPFNEGQALMGMADWTADLRKAEKDLNFHPRGFREVVREYASSMD